MMIVSRILDLHAEEAALAWLRRDRAVGEPHYRLDDLAKLDGRVDGNLDGLRIAVQSDSRVAWKVCEEELQWGEPGEVFSVAVLAWESNQEKRIKTVIKAAAKSYECSRALVSSLGWLTEEAATPYIDQLLAHSKAFQRRAGIATCAVRGCDPGEWLAKALETADKLLKARALRAIGELARKDLLPAARQALRSREPRVQFASAWSVARLTDDEAAMRVLKKTVEVQAPDQSRALQLVVRRMDTVQSARWLQTLSKRPTLLRTAVTGGGIIGLPSSVPWLLQVMDSSALARVAGEAFTMITGVDLATEKLEGNWPAGFHAGPTEDPADNNVEMDPDENLPWPDATKLTTWWDKHRSEFQPETRYLCGRPITEDWLEHVLRHGYQRQRAAAALELALLRPDQPLFNVRAPGYRQQELLGLR